MATKKQQQSAMEDDAQADINEAAKPPIEPREYMNPKVKTAGEGGAVTLILVFVLQQFFPGLEIPPEVASAFTLVTSSILGWLTPDDR